MKKRTTIVALLAALVITAPLAFAEGETIIEYSNGLVVSVPDVYGTVEVVPHGFNTAPFSLKNLAGKAPGWEGYPLRKLLCDDVLSETEFGPWTPEYVACQSAPEIVYNPFIEAEYDFYDTNEDGVIDFGARAGCSYDPFTPTVGRTYDCP